MTAIDELRQLLQQDCDQLAELAQLLGEENRLLAGSNATALEQLTLRKNSLLDQVRARAKQKIQLLVQSGYRPQSGSPSRYIRSTGLTDLVDLWSHADAALADCQRQNQVNGRIISHLQKRLARLTDIFRGTTGHQKLYGASGEQTSVNQRNMLASA